MDSKRWQAGARRFENELIKFSSLSLSLKTANRYRMHRCQRTYNFDNRIWRWRFLFRTRSVDRSVGTQRMHTATWRRWIRTNSYATRSQRRRHHHIDEAVRFRHYQFGSVSGSESTAALCQGRKGKCKRSSRNGEIDCNVCVGRHNEILKFGRWLV